jgi:hypothetical protein
MILIGKQVMDRRKINDLCIPFLKKGLTSKKDNGD